MARQARAPRRRRCRRCRKDFPALVTTAATMRLAVEEALTAGRARHGDSGREYPFAVGRIEGRLQELAAHVEGYCSRPCRDVHLLVVSEEVPRV